MVVVAALVLVVTMVVVVAVAVVAVDALNLEEVDLMASSLSQRGRVLRSNSSLPTQHRAITNTSMFSSHKQMIALIIIIIILFTKYEFGMRLFKCSASKKKSKSPKSSSDLKQHSNVFDFTLSKSNSPLQNSSFSCVRT